MREGAMISYVFLFVFLGLGGTLLSCQFDSSGEKSSGEKKITPFTLNDPGSILVATNATNYPIGGTCHKEGAVITLTVNDAFSNTSEVTPSTAPSCSSKSWSTTVDVSSLGDGTLTVAASYQKSTEEKTVSKDTAAPTIGISSAPNIFPSTASSYGASGTCSEDQRKVEITLSQSGGSSLSPASQPTCTSLKWTVSGWDVNSLANENLILTVSQSDAVGNTTEQTQTIVKSSNDTQVTLGTISAINISNVANYTLNGTCLTGASSSTNETVTVTVGGVTLTTNPTCSNNAWTATFDLSAVNDGASLAIIASYKTAPNATGNILKDVVVPTLTLSTPPAADRITDSTYTLSGACSENGRSVSIVARDSELTPNEVTSQVNCSGTRWQKAMDITSLQAGTLNLSMSHSDLAGNEVSVTSTATRADEVILTLTTPVYIDEENETSYSVSGTCSEDGDDITLSVGSVSPNAAPTCTNFTWEVTGLDVSDLPDGAVTITAVHDDVTKTASVDKGCVSGGGDGLSAENPIIICNYDDLNDIRSDLDASGDIIKHYALGADIDARSSWDDHSAQTSCTAYDGTTIALVSPCSGFAPLPKLETSFDGKGYTISNLYIYTGGSHVGLFSEAGTHGLNGITAFIKNLHLKSIRVHNTQTSSTPSTGGILGGTLSGVAISESSITGKIYGSYAVGGMIGDTEGGSGTIVTNSYADVTVTGTQAVGGIIGHAVGQNKIFNSHSRGTVRGTGSSYGGAGGLAGVLTQASVIYNSYSHASVSGVNSVGSLVGNLYVGSSVVTSYGTGAVGGTSSSKEGIAGSIHTVAPPDTYNDSATLTNNFWDRDTTGQAVNTDQGTGLITADMKVSCAGGSTTGICNLGDGFVFTQGSYPKIKKCVSNCGTGAATFNNDLVIGQND